MRIEPMGEAAYLVRDLAWAPFAFAQQLNKQRPPGLIEAAAAYRSVAVYVDPNAFDVECLAQVVPEEADARGLLWTVPVCFDSGEDLAASATELGMPPSRLVEYFFSVEYRCWAVGFCPGFPYLGYLPTEIRGLSRLPTPRARVPAGSVAITEDQAGIYPIDHPGGWRILGRTPLTIADATADYFPIAAGDRIRFVPIGQAEFEARRGQRL